MKSKTILFFAVMDVFIIIFIQIIAQNEKKSHIPNSLYLPVHQLHG